jgi:hypothetical protein
LKSTVPAIAEAKSKPYFAFVMSRQTISEHFWSGGEKVQESVHSNTPDPK